MNQSMAVWFIIALALVTANLPFALQRHLLVLPWAQAGERDRPFWTRWLESLVFFVLLVALAYFTRLVIGKAVFSGGDPVSVLLFLAKLAGVFVAAVVLLSYAGWRHRGAGVRKPFLARLLELVMFYALVGMLGFGFEMNIGNPFAQGWEFYAVTACLFLVLAYPGFVYRYLLRTHGRRKNIPTAPVS